jgi:uncharacterized protein (UPF0248 family)
MITAGMRTSHRLLLRFWHDASYTFAEVTVRYVSRGSPGDMTEVRGAEISDLDSEYFEILRPGEVTCIPYHRIRSILYKGGVVWKR